MELIKVSPVHEEIIGILTKNNLSYSEAVEVLRTTEIVLGRIVLPTTAVIKKRSSVARRNYFPERFIAMSLNAQTGCPCRLNNNWQSESQ